MANYTEKKKNKALGNQDFDNCAFTLHFAMNGGNFLFGENVGKGKRDYLNCS